MFIRLKEVVQAWLGELESMSDCGRVQCLLRGLLRSFDLLYCGTVRDEGSAMIANTNFSKTSKIRLC